MTILYLEDIRPGSMVCVRTADEVVWGGNVEVPRLAVNVPKGVPLTIRCVNQGSLLFEMVDLVLQGEECHLSMTNELLGHVHYTDGFEEPHDGYTWYADFNFAATPPIPHMTAEINFTPRTIPVPTGKKDIRL